MNKRCTDWLQTCLRRPVQGVVHLTVWIMAICSSLISLITGMAILLVPFCLLLLFGLNASSETSMPAETAGAGAQSCGPAMCIQIISTASGGENASNRSPQALKALLEQSKLGPVQIVPYCRGYKVRSRRFGNLADLGHALVLVQEQVPEARALDAVEIHQWGADVYSLEADSGGLHNARSFSRSGLEKLERFERYCQAQKEMEGSHWEQMPDADSERIQVCIATPLTSRQQVDNIMGDAE